MKRLSLYTALLKSTWIPALIFMHACSTVDQTHTPTVQQPTAAVAKQESVAQREMQDDGPPLVDLDVSLIPNAIPQPEPPSRYGNMAIYEVFGKRYKTMPKSGGYQAKGTASWYGRKFHGKRTSSGEPYDMYGMTAAHISLPLPTYAKVKNLENGREVIVKINDRGPFVHDRLIDLSYAAAKKLGFHNAGTAKVELTAIDPVAWQKSQGKSAKTQLAQAQAKKAPEKGKGKS